MGTRKSRHNKGRKPLYKEHQQIASHLLERPFYSNRGWYNARSWWQPTELFKLNILAEADSDVEGAADALGRPPRSLAFKAKEIGIFLPSEWAKLIETKKKKVYRPKERHQLLAYPYISKSTLENADIRAINDLLPKHFAENMRADMCQEIMLAILEGRTTLEALKSKKGSATYFIRKFYKENFEDEGFAISFDNTSEDWDSDRIASNVAAREWKLNQDAERARSVSYFTKTYTAPTQFEAAWRDQIGRIQLKYHELGQFLSEDEIMEIVDNDN